MSRYQLADTDNAGFEFVGNYIQNSQAVGLQYEISYNALIEFNTFDHNGVAAGPNVGFPTSAIYISESGSDSRVNTDYKGQFLIAHNNFVNNWGGVILWRTPTGSVGPGQQQHWVLHDGGPELDPEDLLDPGHRQ